MNLKTSASALLAAIRRRVPTSFAIAVLTALTVGVMMHSERFRAIDQRAFDFLTTLTAPGRTALPITIVGIDEASFAEVNKQWPWPRSMHAELINRLNGGGAAVIAFDLVLAEPSVAAEDKALAKAIVQAGNVVFAADLTYQESQHAKQWIRVDPLPLFKHAGAVGGLATISLDTDLVVRRMPEGRDVFWREIVEMLLKRQPDAVPRPSSQENKLIGYVGPDHTFPYVSYHEVLNGSPRLTADAFRDQIVIIGRDVRAATDIGSAQADLFATPFSSKTLLLTPGAEVHANILESALSGTTIALHTPWRSVELLLVCLLLSALAMRQWTPILATLATGALGLAVIGLVSVLFIFYRQWLPASGVLIALATVYVANGAIAFIAERKKRLELRHAFAMYLSEDVVNEIITHPEKLKLGGERREVTFVFTDLAGFTDLSERLSAEQVTVILNMHFTRMGRIIKAHRGTLNRFIGDAIMAFWGAPLDDPNQCDNAVQVAAEMIEDMNAMRVELREKGLPDIRMRIGINTGVAVIGNLGSEDRFDYTAVGDCVNLAARLEGVNKLYGTGVLISKETASRVTRNIPLRFVDRVIVKGKTEPVDMLTIESDAQLTALSAEAFKRYLAQDWDGCAATWRQVLAIRADDGVAAVFLARIDELRGANLPTNWNGATALDKM